MKRKGIFSHIKMRTIPLLLAGSLLCSNFIAIDAYADETEMSVEATSEEESGASDGSTEAATEASNKDGADKEKGSEDTDKKSDEQDAAGSFDGQNVEASEGSGEPEKKSENAKSDENEKKSENAEGDEAEKKDENSEEKGDSGDGEEDEDSVDVDEQSQEEVSENENTEGDLNAVGGPVTLNSNITPIVGDKKLGFIYVSYSYEVPEGVSLKVQGEVKRTEQTEDGEYIYHEKADLSESNTVYAENDSVFFTYSYSFNSNVKESDYELVVKFDGNTDNVSISNGTIECVFDENIEKHTLSVEYKKIDNEPPKINGFFKKASGKNVTSGEFKANNAEELTFIVDATDNIGVTNVELVTDRGIVTMNYSDGKYYWTPNSVGVYWLTGVIAYDASGKKSEEYKLNIKVNYISKTVEKDTKVVINNNREWYSSCNTNESNNAVPVVTITGASSDILEKICVKTSCGKTFTVKNVDCWKEDGLICWSVTTKLDIKDMEGPVKFTFTPKYHGSDSNNANGAGSNSYDGKSAEIKINVDNIAPSGTVAFSLDTIDGYTAYTNKVNEYTTEVDTKVDLNPVIAISTSDEIDHVTYKLNGKKITVCDPSKTDDKYVINIDYDACPYARGKYTISNVRIVDKAGNYTEFADTLNYNYDQKGPTIKTFVKYKNLYRLLSSCITNDDEVELCVKIWDDVRLDLTKQKPVFTIGKTEVSIKDEDIRIGCTTDRYAEYYITIRAKDGWDGICLKTTAYDAAGNESTDDGPSMILDNVPPELSFKYDNEPHKTEYGGEEFYSTQNVKVYAIVHEKYPAEDVIKRAIHVVGKNSGELNAVWTWDSDNCDYIGVFETPADDTYEIIIDETNKKWDIAGNDFKYADKCNLIKKFTVDSKSPEVKITFDNDDVRNKKYYNKSRTATITVNDLSFADQASKIEIKNEYGKAVPGDFSGSDGVYVATVPFTEDGIYSFTVTAYDKAGNAPDIKTVEEFVIDATEPKVTVSYNGAAPKNEFYYNSERIATIMVEDMTFSGDLVEYGMQPIADGATLPSIGSFTNSGFENTTYVTFQQDGKYAYVINCTDLAGNTATTYVSDVFVIDTTAPEVDFSGVENYSANNGTVAPTVSYIDKNMDLDATVVTMTGANNGPVSVGNAVTKTENGFVVSYDDFAHDKSMDDLYVLNAKVVDMAGNESEEELVFSVNRFGSVFVLGDATKILNEDYYTNNPQDVTITEINVDNLTYRDVSISRDGEIFELAKDKDYSVTAQGSDTTWKTYTYTLPKENFQKDGVYSVTVYTQDKASNKQDNKSRDAEITFAVDLTNPSIITSGIEAGKTYSNEATHKVNVSVADNMGLTSFIVYRDDKQIASYTTEELEQNGGTIELDLPEADKKAFDLKMVAVDVAGNEQTLTYAGVTITSDSATIIDPPKPIGPRPGPSNNLPIYIIISFGAIALASGAGIFAYRYKKASK